MRFLRKNISGGFTLIEILVAVSIISILMAVATVSYINVQRKSRDIRRKTDLEKVRQALEVFYADNGAYPDEAVNDRISCVTNGDRLTMDSSAIDWGDPFVCNGKTYLANLPKGPNGENYYYEIYEEADTNNPPDPPDMCAKPGDGDGGNCHQYALWARLENSDDPDVAKSYTDSICYNSIYYHKGERPFGFAAYMPSSIYPQGINQDFGTNYCVHSPR